MILIHQVGDAIEASPTIYWKEELMSTDVEKESSASLVCKCGDIFHDRPAFYEHGDNKCPITIRRDISAMIELLVAIEVERASRICKEQH